MSDECTNFKDGGYDSTFDVLLKRGNAYLEKGDYDSAIAEFTKILKIDPDNVNVLFRRGVAYASKCDYDNAIEDYNTALEIDPNNGMVLQWRSYAYPLVTPKIGKIIPFGEYDWHVLAVQNNKALLLSEKIIEKRCYHSTCTDITWAECELRDYLNGEFYNKFNSHDRVRIAETRIITNDNPWYGTKGGSNTTDRMFLLSIEEVVKYFGDSRDLKNRKGWYWENSYFVLKDGKGYYINDQYNNVRITKDASGSSSWWWLRSPGLRSDGAARVLVDGCVNVTGYSGNLDYGGVRPALWLNLHPFR